MTTRRPVACDTGSNADAFLPHWLVDFTTDEGPAMAVSISRDSILLERRYAAVLATVSDESLANMAIAVDEKLRDALARLLALPVGAFEEHATLAPRMREAMAKRKAHLDAGVIMGEAATEKAIEMLGDRSDDPSLEEIQAVLPELIESFGLDAVRMMTVQYSTSLGGFRKLLTTDERFALPSSSTTATGAANISAVNTAAQEEKRRQRAERKQKEREERARAEAQRRHARGRK